MPLYMQEITNKAQLDTFVQSQPENVLTVVNVSSNATPCVRVFPAILALAKNFVGYAAFARLLYETSDETQSLANQLKVREVGSSLSLCQCICGLPVTCQPRITCIGTASAARKLQPAASRCRCHHTCSCGGLCVLDTARPHPGRSMVCSSL